MASEARAAATVVVLREAPDGPELLMLKRSGSAGFFPHAWVFPGGRVDDADAEAASTGQVLGDGVVPPKVAVAAVRETYEESGVWLGSGSPPPGFRDELNSRASTMRDAPELVADLGRMGLWSRWITPEMEPKRYDTWFFVTQIDAAGSEHARHDETETVSSVWIRPDDAVQRSFGGDFFLAPPTFLTLMELSMFDTVEAIMAASRLRQVRPIMPRLDKGDGTWTIVLPGDPSYPSDLAVEGPTRIEFRQGRWWAS
jgi:8-oxo-dGTP pyrophosphatase MutT (NUDIX family)